MRIGVDTNVIVEAHVPGRSRSELASRYLEEQLAHADVTLAVTPLVLHEVIHIATDPRRFERPLSMTDALAVNRDYLGRSNVECLPVDEDSLAMALELLQRHRLGRSRVSDCLLAATLLSHGVQRLATFNPRDFALFEPLRAFEPALQT